MKTKFLAVLTAAAIILSFAACGKSTNGTTTAVHTTVAVTTETSTTLPGGTTAVTTDITTAEDTQTDARTSPPTTSAPTTAVPTTKVQTTSVPTTAKAKTFSKTELAKYDGKNGNKAYIAYNGKVYDVSAIWVNGYHHNLKAGTDITIIYNLCNKHGSSIFSIFTIIGTYTG